MGTRSEYLLDCIKRIQDLLNKEIEAMSKTENLYMPTRGEFTFPTTGTFEVQYPDGTCSTLSYRKGDVLSLPIDSKIKLLSVAFEETLDPKQEIIARIRSWRNNTPKYIGFPDNLADLLEEGKI